MTQNGLAFVAKCAAVLPVLWLVLFLIALPFPGGHPSLSALVAVLPAAVSLTGRAAGWLMGDAGTFSVSLTVLVVDLRQAPGVDFSRLTESFAGLNTMMFERMVAALPDRPELLNPIFRIAPGYVCSSSALRAWTETGALADKDVPYTTADTMLVVTSLRVPSGRPPA